MLFLMPKSSITFTPAGARGMQVILITDRGWTLRAQGTIDEALPTYDGERRLQDNKVLSVNLWAYACAEKERRVSRNAKRREALHRAAKAHHELTLNIADLVDKVGDETRSGWCSACFQHTDHHKVEGGLSVPTYLCGTCGAATLRCAAPRCKNMATRGFGAVRVPRFCAAHRHELPSFENGDARLGELENYRALLEYDVPNLAKTTKLAGAALVAAGAMTGVGLMAAPLIGGLVGTTIGGYSGAAATSYGLALLGGGSVASGGLGMAGGTAVVAAVGGGLGGVMGAGITNAYVREDKSFDIEKLKDGAGVAVIVCSGFLNEGKTGWGDWERLVTERYPDSPVYRVHWGSKELKDLGLVLGVGATKGVAAQMAKVAALRASKEAAKKASPIGGGLIVVDLVKNPWWLARQRANKTGAALADFVARTELKEVVLVGHSLGARAMVCAAESLATKNTAPTVRELHLLGAAIGADRDWTKLETAVSERAYNYHSSNDKVLKFFYSTAEAGHQAAGHRGMKTKRHKIVNVDVSRTVGGHSDYCKVVALK